MERERLGRGTIQVYTGNGKGKTTASLGLALRAIGHGYRVYMIQFMKGDIEYGELISSKKLLAPYLTIKQMGRADFVNRENPEKVDVDWAKKAFKLAQEVVLGGEYDVVILDEVNVAVDFGLVVLEDLLELMRDKPENVELVLTGRYAKPEVVQKADLVTEMLDIKHYYAGGIESRKGIER
ncbi:MAG: cob(I)yrinic acid a,c-diamide adenosyltransferase [Deltaproteobacteria bacterium CG2_30_43_15]|nr:MAG: cob(I)yrinic acid a,c-diamide adenosyltransferase [Deltaproteobacteria bacterium CG2_30_43_15]